jgi:hypothetical protein
MTSTPQPAVSITVDQEPDNIYLPLLYLVLVIAGLVALYDAGYYGHRWWQSRRAAQEGRRERNPPASEEVKQPDLTEPLLPGLDPEVAGEPQVGHVSMKRGGEGGRGAPELGLLGYGLVCRPDGP